MFIYIIYILCNYIFNTSQSIIYNKNEVLNIHNEFYISFYCKDNICVSTDYSYLDKTIEIPNNKGEMIKYITDTCRYDNIDYCITNCTINSECLSNKCYNNKCIFNEENPIIHCDNIYINNKSSYMYCGKAYLDICNNNDECSSKKCHSTEKYCLIQTDGPQSGHQNDTNNLDKNIYLFRFIMILITILFLILIYIGYKYIPKYKKHITIILLLLYILSIIITYHVC